MKIATGTVMSGKVVLNVPAHLDLADGTGVFIVTRDGQEAPDEQAAALSSDELAELEAGVAEADRGDLVTGVDFWAQLRRHEQA